MTITTILWSLIIGITVGIVYTYYTKQILGKLVRKLLLIDATSYDAAISLKQLGIKLTPAVKYALRPGTSFSETVLLTESGSYYINPKSLEKAKIKYRDDKTTFIVLIAMLAMAFVLALISTYIFPEVVDKFLELIESFK